MEYLRLSNLGQWTLCKTAAKPFKVYGGSTISGELHEDHGQKGTLHNFGGGQRPKPSWNKRWVNKPVVHREPSVAAERNPGLGIEEVE